MSASVDNMRPNQTLDHGWTFQLTKYFRISDFVTLLCKISSRMILKSLNRYLCSRVAMQSVVRAASLGQLSRASVSAVPNLAGAVAPASEAANAPTAGVVVEPTPVPLSSFSMSKQLLKGNQIRITSGLGGNHQDKTLQSPCMQLYRHLQLQKQSILWRSLRGINWG